VFKHQIEQRGQQSSLVPPYLPLFLEICLNQFITLTKIFHCLPHHLCSAFLLNLSSFHRLYSTASSIYHCHYSFLTLLLLFLFNFDYTAQPHLILVVSTLLCRSSYFCLSHLCFSYLSFLRRAPISLTTNNLTMFIVCVIYRHSSSFLWFPNSTYSNQKIVTISATNRDCKTSSRRIMIG